MTSEAHREPIWTTVGQSWRKSRWRLRLRRLRRAVEAGFSSSLTRRIVSLNLGGLVLLVLGIFWLNPIRADIVEARIQSLTTQAGIISAAIAASVATDNNTIQFDPEKLLQLAPEKNAAAPNDEDAIQFSINPEKVGPELHRLVSPTHTRARIYDRDGALLLDTQTLSARPSPYPNDEGDAAAAPWPLRMWLRVQRFFEPERPQRGLGGWMTNGKTLPEVAEALRGETASIVRSDYYTTVSVAAPIRRANVIKGVLVLSTMGRDIDKQIASEHFALLRFFGVIAGVMLILSLALANTIAEPVRKIADAADRVRRGIKSRQPIPDFTSRADEIGHLSRALGEMTEALYTRIDAIESFAADVAHELKNPLTSLRSAVETLPRVKPGPMQDRLLSIVQHDVKRLDRLISDISDASRLDAELVRGEAEPVDVAALIDAVVAMLADSPRCRGVAMKVSKDDASRSARYFVFGHDSRLAQVITNLADNACSFSEPGGEVRIRLKRAPDDAPADYEATMDRVVIEVEDDGPGIPPHALERVFERFYTDRPVEGFGQNSGLGLSISRQIVEAHRGRIWAENRPLPPGRRPEPEDPDAAPRHSAGARFVVSLPAARAP